MLFGWSVSLSSDGSTVAVGVPQGSINGGNSGKVEVFSLNGTSSVLNALNDVSINLYPNPTSGSFSLSKEALEVSLYDIAGKRVKQFTKNTIKSNLYLVPDLKTGIYFVRIKNYSNNITTKKLVLSHLR